ncbi:hypothetical protein [Brevundimonas naejangsanensis]|uniref:hypothetical protein n=1 Tax=Brevundimonas naejangsanensis TaxID=588932 RepID=UPI0032099516
MTVLFLTWAGLAVVIGVLLVPTRRGLLSPRQFGLIVAALAVGTSVSGLYAGGGHG